MPGTRTPGPEKTLFFTLWKRKMVFLAECSEIKITSLKSLDSYVWISIPAFTNGC